MKPFLALVFVLCFGCSQSNSKLEARVAALEKRTDDLTHDIRILMNGLEGISETVSNSLTGIVRTNAIMNARLMDRVEDVITATQAQQSPAIAQPQVRSVPVQPRALPSRDGIPIQVWNQIAAEAQRKWPREYDMQMYEIEKQVTAYRRLHGG